MVDNIDRFVMYESQVSHAIASSICLVSITKWYCPYSMYVINNDAKYYMAKRRGKNEFRGYNPHYGWTKLVHDVVIHLLNKVTDATQSENREVFFNDTGSRIASIDNISTKWRNKVIPTDYQ